MRHPDGAVRVVAGPDLRPEARRESRVAVEGGHDFSYHVKLSLLTAEGPARRTPRSPTRWSGCARSGGPGPPRPPVRRPAWPRSRRPPRADGPRSPRPGTGSPAGPAHDRAGVRAGGAELGSRPSAGSLDQLEKDPALAPDPARAAAAALEDVVDRGARARHLRAGRRAGRALVRSPGRARPAHQHRHVDRLGHAPDQTERRTRSPPTSLAHRLSQRRQHALPWGPRGTARARLIPRPP